jgi:uroporphyrinogen decarboxylase
MATDLQAFQDTTAHRRPGRILYGGGFVPDLHKRVVEHIGTEDVAGYYGFAKEWGLGPRPPAGYTPPDYSRYWHGQDLPPGTTFDGNGVAMVPSGYFHFWGYVSPLRNAESLAQIENYPLTDVTGWDFSHLPGEVAKAHAAGQIAVVWVGHMYEIAWQIRGYEQFLLDTIERPAWAECLLERLYQQNMIRAVAAAKAGADLAFCGDDVANQNALMFSPDTWRKLIHSRWASLWRTIKQVNPAIRIKYHTDGNISAIIPELIEAGLDILNPMQPECLDLDDVHRRYGRRLTFDGCIGTQSTMPWGTPEEVRARVKEVIDKYGRQGGLSIAPTHVLEPEVPLANIDALFETCREYGNFEAGGGQ